MKNVQIINNYLLPYLREILRGGSKKILPLSAGGTIANVTYEKYPIKKQVFLLHSIRRCLSVALQAHR
jgi:hypothetical protein